MKIVNVFVGVALATVLNCTAANAQVLGGNVAGGLGGTLSGGMRDVGVLTRGNGSFAGDVSSSIDTRSVGRATGDTVGRTTDRVRDTAGATRKGVESSVAGARDRVQTTNVNVSSSAAVAATHAVDAAPLDSAASATGAAASDVTATGMPQGLTADGAIATASSVAATDMPRGPDAPGAIDGAGGDGMLQGAAQSSVEKASGELGAAAAGNASASSDASASSEGVSARSAVAADGRGSLQVSK